MLDEVREQEEGTYFLRRVVEGHFTSPLLLVGDEGCGRRFSVIQATKELFCSGSRGTGCDCADCVQIDKGVHPDFLMLAPEGDRDIGVDVARSVVALDSTCPTVAPCRIFVVDGADRLTTAAANALLKTLEEPSTTSRWFLLAESSARVLPTIRSRCGIVSYRPLSEALIVSVLQQFEHDPAKALVYARLSEGSVGRAVRYWGSGRLVLRDKTLSLIRLALEKDVAGLFSAIDALEKDLPQVLRFTSQLLRDVLMVRLDTQRVLNLDRQDDLMHLASKADALVWQQLAAGVHALRGVSRSTKVYLPFQVKALFAQALGV